jgi:hypothetical protein
VASKFETTYKTPIYSIFQQKSVQVSITKLPVTALKLIPSGKDHRKIGEHFFGVPLYLLLSTDFLDFRKVKFDQSRVDELLEIYDYID